MRRSWFFVLSLAVVLVLSACQPPAFLQGEMPDDGPPVATTPAAAQRFAEKVAAAGERAVETKRLNITVTQKEVTSFLNIGSQMAQQLQDTYGVSSLKELQQLQQQQGLARAAGLPDWVKTLQQAQENLGVDLPDLSLAVRVKDPEVYFRGNGQIIVRGYGQVLGLREPLRLVLAPRASKGELVLDFVEGTLGPVSVPEGLVDLVGKGLARLILAGSDYVQVSKIEVSGGSLTLRGRYLK